MISLNPGALLAIALILAAAGLLALVITLRLRSRRRPRRPRLNATAPAGGPQIGERWMADVPFEDEPHRSKQRPCLVIGYSGRGYWVLKCTTQPPREAEWRVHVPADRWNPDADRDGYVDLVPYHLPKARLEHSFGRIADRALYGDITGSLRWERAVDFIG
ncbi:hypothetical protein [Glycomyces tritici]|uniref:Type II toxin-antitoxin system PemK/MazF family toxin n=1 Tax=Glycomyces tritici TaxID=2665176 RepID=A0ABT7YND7_9ACTN|nr:hypothetical protein [Glycomyces tritici]MDN3240128.1 hypothetical protein [Glycomyces tritici]